MKRFVKGCLIMAVILLIVGAVFIGIVIAKGDADKISDIVSEATDGKVELHLDSWKDWGIHFGENWGGGYNINDAGMFDKNHEVWEGDVKKTEVGSSTVTALDINVGGCRFEVKESEDQSYYIEYKGKGKLQAYEESNVLYVNSLLHEVSWGTEKSEEHVILYVPEETSLDVITLELGAGKMLLADMGADTISISLGAGDVEWKALQAKEIEFEIGAGQVVVTEAALGEVDISMGAGKCQIQGEISGDVEVDCAAGQVDLALEGEENEFNYEISCVVGNVRIGTEKYSGLAETKEINHNASRDMEFSCAAGNIEVTFK